ncbi:MAG: RNA polymerase, partial [Flavobacterium psychrophilum]
MKFVANTITQEAFLKLWAFRERMTSMDHVIRFLQLT